MNEKKIIMVFLCFFIGNVFAQTDNQYKSLFFQSEKKTIKYKLSKISHCEYSGRNSNLMYYSDTYTDADILLPDSLYDCFVITRINKKKNNYIQRKRLVKQSIYMVDVNCVTQVNPPAYINVIIPKEMYKRWNFEIGDTLNTTIYPLFWRDKFLEKNGDSIYTTFPSLKTPISLVFQNIWIENLQSSFRNYFFIRCDVAPQTIIARRKHKRTQKN